MSASATTLHHLILAVFNKDGNRARVLLHASIVAFETAVLVWVSDKVVQSFDRIGRVSDELVAKSQALEARPLDLRSALSCQVQMVADTVAARSLSLRQEIDDRLPDVLVGDELRLSQIVLNLPNSAAKFSTQGEIILSARLIGLPHDQAQIQIAVSDSSMSKAQPAPPVHAFHAGRHIDHAAVRRDGAGAGHLSTDRPAHGRLDPRRKRLGPGQPLYLWPDPCRGAARRGRGGPALSGDPGAAHSGRG